jgi:hypothetical protein
VRREIRSGLCLDLISRDEMTHTHTHILSLSLSLSPGSDKDVGIDVARHRLFEMLTELPERQSEVLRCILAGASSLPAVSRDLDISLSCVAQAFTGLLRRARQLKKDEIDRSA